MNLARRYLITGSRGAFGSALKQELERAGAVVTAARFAEDWDYANYDFFSSQAMRDIDVLILAHGAKDESAMAANFTSFVAIAERFRAARAHAEIWGVGSEVELHPAPARFASYLESKRAFARYAASLYRDQSITYRHIVPAAFRSRMGGGLISARTAARWALALVRRNWKYVPVTYTGIAYLNYPRFRRLASEARGRG